ncbi:uncharacterized protein CIMG_01577 [Coccidioides immitis RS]|uniref:Nucleic acid-binding protein n=3 Tax=Coccidioides immitis TaxID=5501 RepID=A0A0E1S538_COCIM|nr:uncharacterized protein CIMG_01577 [Coccidioides immitis RS]EAS36223.1 hypothetical protein CIMG_01577 [Coccidioides immitis RS]KMP01554.1 hypothetical protein CIRG_01693 [Coccidioides immitis RMSCC 2394]KMU76471.1 hypothetical protein CISG_01204 [Coccidioides immitis RMSCC 3703]TPX25637.1 hypothetical protein DIZ76_011093 [Coccidioides immitis]
MAYRVIAFSGLPPRSALNWDESELLQPPLPPFYQPRSLEGEGLNSQARWRSLAPIKIPSFMSPTYGASFFTMGTIQRYSGDSVSLDVDESTLSEFYDQSFALHEGTHHSFTSVTKSFTDDSELTPSFEGESLDYSMSKLSQSKVNQQNFEGQPVYGHLIDVEDIPSAMYLQSLAPRKVIVSLVVAIINIQPRRRVQTRWGREMDIVELLVGDETKAGFRVSCWVPPSTEDTRTVTANSLEQSLTALRLRDIILLRHIVLGSFRGQVYGQSLRQNMTKVDVLDREDAGVGQTDRPGEANRSGPHALKIREVRRWMRKFVTPGAAGREDVNNFLFVAPAGTVQLPPDTQE